MRQSLDPADFDRLPDASRFYFRAWMLDHGFNDFARPTVGQLLAFLIEHEDPFKIEYTPDRLRVHTGWNERHGWYNREPYGDLLPCLWSSVAYWLENRRERYLLRTPDERPPHGVG